MKEDARNKEEKQGDYGVHSWTPGEQPGEGTTPTWPICSSGSELGWKEATERGELMAGEEGRESGSWVARGESRSPLLPTRTPQWNVPWQQPWAFCSESAREQQGLGRTRTSLKVLAASSMRFSRTGNSDNLLGVLTGLGGRAGGGASWKPKRNEAI